MTFLQNSFGQLLFLSHVLHCVYCEEQLIFDMKMKKKWGVTFDIRIFFYFHFDDPNLACFCMADEYIAHPFRTSHSAYTKSSC